MENKKECIFCTGCYPVEENKWACSIKGEFIKENDKACEGFEEVEYIQTGGEL